MKKLLSIILTLTILFCACAETDTSTLNDRTDTNENIETTETSAETSDPEETDTETDTSAEVSISVDTDVDLIGKWFTSNGSEKASIEFKPDGFFTSVDSDEEMNGTYYIHGDEITVVIHDDEYGDEGEFNFFYEIRNGLLFLEDTLYNVRMVLWRDGETPPIPDNVNIADFYGLWKATVYGEVFYLEFNSDSTFYIIQDDVDNEEGTYIVFDDTIVLIIGSQAQFYTYEFTEEYIHLENDDFEMILQRKLD